MRNIRDPGVAVLECKQGRYAKEPKHRREGVVVKHMGVEPRHSPIRSVNDEEVSARIDVKLERGFDAVGPGSHEGDLAAWLRKQ